MTSYLVDTSVIIDYIKGREPAYVLLNSVQGNFVSSYFCLAELYEGIRSVHNPDYHEQAALDYFASLSKVYGLDIHIVQKFGELRVRLTKQENIIEDIDLFIASTCLAHDLTLITFNKRHFLRIEELQVL